MEKLKTAFSDLILLAGLALACCGVFKFSHAAGFIASGIILVYLAKAITPPEKKKS